MQTHCHADADKLAADRPNFFAVGFNEGEVMATNEEALDEFETVGLVFCSVTVEGGAHDVVKFMTNFLEGVAQLDHEAVTWWEVVYGDAHDHADGCEDDTVCVGACFVTGPSVCECGSVYVAIYPVAVFKVVGHEAVDDLEGGKVSEEVSVVFVCRDDLVEVGVMTGLAVAVVGLPRVLWGGVRRGWERGEGGNVSTRVRWVTADVAPA